MKKQDDLAVCRSVRYTRGPRKGTVKCSQCGFFFVTDEQMYPLREQVIGIETHITGTEWFKRFKCCPNCLPPNANAPYGGRRCLGKKTRGSWESTNGCGVLFNIDSKARLYRTLNKQSRHIQFCSSCRKRHYPKCTTYDMALSAGKEFCRLYHRAPTEDEWERRSETPSRSTIEKLFGNWNNFIYALEGSYRFHPLKYPSAFSRIYDDRFIVIELSKRAKENNGAAIAIKLWRRNRWKPSASTIIRHFGTWDNAWRTIGIEPNPYATREHLEKMWIASGTHPDKKITARKVWQDARLLDRITQLAQESADAEQRWQEHKFKRKS